MNFERRPSDSPEIATKLEPIDKWPKIESNGWASEAVGQRFEAGARGEITTECLKFGGDLSKFPASRELISTFGETGLGAPVLLDFGCANGIYAEMLAQHELTRHWKYIGVDVNPHVIESCRSRFPQHEFLVSKPGMKLPLEPNSVDMILASGVLECIEDTQQVLCEFHRITRHYAVLFRIPAKAAPAALYLQTVQHDWGTEQHAFQVFDRQALNGMIQDAGFRIEKCEVSRASGSWMPPDGDEPILQYLYLIKKAGDEIDASSSGAVAAHPDTHRWLEARLADAQFEVESLQKRLKEAIDLNKRLERKLKRPHASGSDRPDEPGISES